MLVGWPRWGQRCDLAAAWAWVLSPSFPERNVAIFVDGTAAYVLSKSWDDALSIFLFRLHPPPDCAAHEPPHCPPQASSSTQFLYAIFMLLPTAALKLSASSSRLRSIPGADTIPSMAGMLAGWGFGNAFIQLFTEIRQAHAQVACRPLIHGEGLDCTAFHVSLASLLTVCAVALVSIVRPLTQGLQFGEGEVSPPPCNRILFLLQMLSLGLAPCLAMLD